MNPSQYIEKLNTRFKTGISREHSYRGDLQILLESLLSDMVVTNEPARINCGAPDYIITKNGIPIGYIEAKDIGADLRSKSFKEQFERYRASLSNLIFTDYLDFHFYEQGEFVTSISIAELKNGSILAKPDQFAQFISLIKNFGTQVGQTIKSAKKLAEMMAGKARLLSDIIEKALLSDEESHENSTLKEQMNAFKQVLIHDITPKGFADIYAQTIAYGMFAARLHDPTLPTFSRQEAAELIPKSNPFLRKLFGYIAGPDIDDRIKWVVDSLTEVFLACNVEEILKNYGKTTKTEDPIIHFYETFLSEYDPKLRKARGVWYTPAPVVNFIVRAVDEILKTEFGLPNGLADNSKTKIKVQQQNKYIEKEVHKVQILDPATGTGTFLAEVVKLIYKRFEGQQGIWNNYVENHLLPRLNGFELLMASYAMAHLKLDLLLGETGFKPTNNQRFRVYLTNSLEESHPDTGTLFANWLSVEANEANHIKRDTPVMCVIGNPPYSGESANKGEWIMNLMDDYKKEPGGKEKLKERNPKWINDDYVKFLRYGQHFIEKNGSGVLAFINPHGFLDNPTFRGMRWNLLKTYDKIYTLDLHGNSNIKEISPDGSADVNVFDIKQGVSINIFIKTGNKKSNDLSEVYHCELWGKREEKYNFLLTKSLNKIDWKEITPNKPDLIFIPQVLEIKTKYNVGLSLKDMFLKKSIGVQTHRDELVIDFIKEILNSRLIELFTTDNLKSYAVKYGVKESHSWNLDLAIKKEINLKSQAFRKITYRPFDERTIYYSDNFVDRTRKSVGKEILDANLVINFAKIVKKADWDHSLITKSIPTAISMDINGTYFAPLYLYPESRGQQTIGKAAIRTPNLNMDIVNEIAKKLGMKFTPEKNSPPFEEEYLKGEVVTTTPSPSFPGGEYKGIGGEHEVSTFAGGDRINNLPHLKTFRQKLRNNLTPAEATFWTLVKNSQLDGRKFRRQHSVGNYILDFYCPSERIAIELDGEVHNNISAQEYDNERTLFLNAFGIKVLRFENKMVFENSEYVLNEIRNSFGWNIEEIKKDSYIEHNTINENDTFAPIDILDYIYAVLHSPTYREKYKEFLKIDFPRVPYPKDKHTFWNLVKLGGELRSIHLLESPIVEQYSTQYPISGDNVVSKVRYENNNVYINDTQCFANVSPVAWNFYIGGYQPAQKWLKDRKGRELEFDDILHYQKIIVALNETARIMGEIDLIDLEEKA